MGKWLSYFILITYWLQSLFGTFFVSSTLTVFGNNLQILCPSGEKIAVPSGIQLEMAPAIERAPSLVRVPIELQGQCEYGFLDRVPESIFSTEENYAIELSLSDFLPGLTTEALAIETQLKGYMDQVLGDSNLLGDGSVEPPQDGGDEVSAKLDGEDFQIKSETDSADIKADPILDLDLAPKVEEALPLASPSPAPKQSPKKTRTKKTTYAKKTRRENRKVKVLAKIATKMKYADSCKSKFVSAHGIGALGKYIKKELSQGHYRGLLKNTKAFRNVCPGFQKMSMEEKKNLWVLILMSMSHFESSCRSQVENTGPNGIAKGLLQLHEGAEDRYTHWDQTGVCKKGDSKKPKDSIQCTLSMLNGQVQRFNSIFFQGSYWDVLRNVRDPKTHAAKIRAAIRMLPGCNNRAMASNIDRHDRG